MDVLGAIRKNDLPALKQLLAQKPELANEIIHWGPDQTNASHPLHFLCDAVFEKQIAESDALEMAKWLFEAGANINGPLIPGKDTPIIAACSLYTDRLGLFYLSQQPILEHKGVHGGTCLHWAAYTGSDLMVSALINHGMSLDDAENEFHSTPIEWAIHAAQQKEPPRNQRNQLKCIRLLAKAGAHYNKSSVNLKDWPEIEAALRGG